MTGRAAIITDWGRPLRVVGADDHDAGCIPRYGVWQWVAGRHECVATGDDLEQLRARYGRELQVVTLMTQA